MNEPRLHYEDSTALEGRVRFWVVGGNGEVQVRSEWYESRSNAERGFDDLCSAIDRLRADPPDIAA